MAQAIEIITDAYFMIGLLGEGEALNATRADFALRRLNGMLGSWQNEALLTRVIAEVVGPIGPGNSFTIGPTGDLVHPTVPVSLEGGGFFRESNIDYQLEIIGREEYLQWPFKSILTSRPIQIYYDPGIEYGTCFLYPGAVGTIDMHLQVSAPTVGFPDLTTEVLVPAGYEEAYTTSLAEILCEGKIPVPQDLAKRARVCRDRIRSSNVDPGTLVHGTRGNGNIYDGYFF
jgi:hypothetical protein